MNLRQAIPADADAILALWKDSETTRSVTDTADEIRRISTGEYVAFILATEDENIIGSVIATFDGWRGNMYRLATHPLHRRKGIARALVSEAERIFAKWGVKRITALVERDHGWAVDFWEAAGYVADVRMSRYVRNLEAHKSGATTHGIRNDLAVKFQSGQLK